MENSKFSLKNFRVFDDQGAEFEMAPITVLTGCNSSGKSSVIKSLMLFGDMCQNIYNDYQKGNPVFLNQYEIRFNYGKHNLGNYHSALSKYSKTKDLIFGYSKYSHFLLDNVQVELVMSINEQDFLKNGIIKNVKISIGNKELAYFEVVEKNLNYRINAIELKKRFFQYYDCHKEYVRISKELNRDQSDYEYFKYWKDYETYLSESSINHRKIETIINSMEQTFKRDDVNELYVFLNQINGSHKSLFYFPVLDWFGEAGKDNITELVKLKIKEFNDTSDEFKPIENAMIEMIEEFKNSDFLTVKEFFLSIENKFLSEFSETLFLAKKPGRENFQCLQDISILRWDITSFVRLIYKLFAKDVYSSIDLQQIKDILDKLSSYERYFYTLVLFCAKDDEFNKRIEEPDVFEFNFRTYYIPTEINAVSLFLSTILQELLINAPSFLNKIEFVEAVKANIQRMYTFKNQGTPFNDLIQNYLGLNRNSRYDSKKYKIGDFTRKWLKRFTIGDDIVFELTPDGLGVHVYLIKGNEKRLLADEGYGITQLLAILLQIELNIVNNSYEYSHPFISGNEIKYYETTISIEEPETNLHPKYQSMLAEMFMDAYKTYNIRFIVETHSEYLIRKLQTLVAKKELTPNDVALHYIYEHDPKKRPAGKPQVLKIDIKEDGRLSESFGTGFFDEADNLAMDLLIVKSLN